MARRAARLEKDCCASVPQHPYDSTAKGMHTHPSSAHFESLALCFLASANRAEDPHLTPASVKVIGLSSEVTVRSKAADTALDTLGHHAVTCRRGGDVITCHNCLRDTFVDLCRNAHLSVQVEVGNNLTLDNSRPADILVGNWDRGKPAAFDFTVSTPLSSAILSEANANTGAAARSAEELKHRANDVKCAELGWSCVPLAVETYGAWSDEAQCTISRLASLLYCGICLAQGSPPILAQLDSG
eukprot:Em0001g2396a